MAKCPIKKRVARILGNFGIDFFKPLIGINIGLVAFQIPFTVQAMIWSSFIAALIGLGLTISREAIDYGSTKK